MESSRLNSRLEAVSTVCDVRDYRLQWRKRSKQIAASQRSHTAALFRASQGRIVPSEFGTGAIRQKFYLVRNVVQRALPLT